MFGRHKRITAGAVLVLGLGVAGAAIGGGQAGSASGPVRCAIEASQAGGMITLEGVVRSDVAVSGSYRLRVTSAGGGGGTSIDQGGPFAAGPHSATALGRVMLGGNTVYDARLDVTANGVTLSCAERVGGAI